MAVGMEEVEILKPRNDQRQYRRIVLKNMLEVLLVSDPETDKAAASMNVGVGYFCDPDGLEGLAHFLEHMLFYASEKYPEEDTYSKYITEHGGSTNAFTSSENTNYHFDVNSDCFEEALDRFAQFFIKPLMSADATMREIKAVDSENQKNLLSDSWRMYQMLYHIGYRLGWAVRLYATTLYYSRELVKSLIYADCVATIPQLQKHLTTESHPYHKFTTGNLETLNVRPAEKGIDTRLELLKFYEEYYSANLMHLVVYSKGSLDKLQNLVENKFEEIRNIDRSRPNFPGPLCSSEHTQIVVKTVPIKEGHKLRIVWPVTPSIHHYKEGPSRYLGHLIGHEGDGSLFHVLKTLGWASSLSASESEWSLDYSFFTVLIELTDAGHEHVQDIIALMFKYISLLQHSGVCNWIFDELSAVCETKFHYQDKTPPIDYVVNIATNMRFYPPRDWLVESSLPSVFNPEIIQTQLNELTASNVRVFWASKKFEGHVDMVEPWYGTAYSLDKISLSTIQQWIVSAPSVNLHLPSPNIFIPTDFSIKNSREAKFPSLLRNSLSYNLWYKPDTMFKSPKAYVKIDFNCPYSSNSPEAEVLTDIFTRLLMDYLNEYAYYAQIAGLHYGVSHTNNGFQVTVFGYNHKLWILLETVIDKIAKFKVKPDRFLVIKEVVIKEYQNYKFQQPYQQAMYYCSILLQDQTWPWMEQLEVLSHLDSTDLEKFVPLMLSRTFLECYVAGNTESSEAESMVLHIEGILFNGPKAICQNVFPSQRTTNRVVKLRRGLSYYYPVEGLNQDDDNSSLVHYIQVHQDDFLMNVKLQLFALVAKQPAFHQLRSVEQLGYIVALLQRNDNGVRGVQFIIQSTAKGPKSIDLRVESFLKSFESKLYEISDDEFKSNVNALIDMKLEKHKNLKEECRFYWQEISQGTLKFDRREFEVAALRELKKQELIDFFDKHVKNSAALKKALSVRVYGKLHASEYTTDNSDPPPANSVKIDDIFTFRGSQTLYGSLKCSYGLGKL